MLDRGHLCEGAQFQSKWIKISSQVGYQYGFLSLGTNSYSQSFMSDRIYCCIYTMPMIKPDTTNTQHKSMLNSHNIITDLFPKKKLYHKPCQNANQNIACVPTVTALMLMVDPCQSMLTTWDSFPQGKQNNELIASQGKIQKTIHQQLKIAAAETTNTNKSEDLQ